MIGYLTGKILFAKPTKIILDVNGVGFSVNISVNTYENIFNKEEISLFIHTHLKEDSISLYGFFTEAEKEMFELLISVSGIGPKIAQSILSGINVDDLKYAIESGNISHITSIPGIGRKTAERLFVELRGKIESIILETELSNERSIKNEALSALINLGYNKSIAEKTIKDILIIESNISLEDLIKKSLSNLNK